MDAAFLTDLLECSVCLEQLDTSSKVLPCQHTFCKQCLQEIVTSHKELRCPECRTLVDCNIDELPCNILLIRLLEGIKHSSRFQQTPSKSGPGEKEAEDGKAVTSPTVPPVLTGSPGGQVQPLPTAQTVAQHDRAKLGSKQIGFALPCAKALYTYEAKEPGDLAFKKGDVILLKKRLDQNWFQGELNGQSGFLPASYVQVLAPMAHIVPQCKALYDFAISSNDQQDCLTFNKGDIITVIRRIDENWAEGKMTDKIGIFPVSFVQMNAAAKTIMKLSANTFSGPSRVAPPTPTSDDVQSSEETTTSAGSNPPTVVGPSESLNSVPGPSPSVPTSPSSSCSSPPVITTTAVPLNTPMSTPSHSAPISHPRSSCSQQHRDKRHSMAVLSTTGQQQQQQSSPQAASHRHSLEILSSESPVGDCQELPMHVLSNMTTTVTTAVSQFSTTLIPTLVTAKGPDSSGSKGHRRVCSRKENCYSAVCIKSKEASTVPTPVTVAPVPAVTSLSTSNIPQAASALPSHQTPINALYVALYNYKPQKEDELQLRKGDLYTVSEKCQDGWFKGTSLQSGKSGVFPGNYVHLSKPAALQGQTSLAPTSLSTVRSVQSGKATPPGTGSVSTATPSSGHHHHHHHHHHHTRHKSFSSLAGSVDLPSILPSSSSLGEGTNGLNSKAVPSETNSQEWAQAVPSELSSVSSSHEWTAVVSPVFLQPQQQAKVLTASPQVSGAGAICTATTSSDPGANPPVSASPVQKAVMPSYAKGLKGNEGNPWCRSWQSQAPQESPGGSPFQSVSSSINTNGSSGRVDFGQAVQVPGPVSGPVMALSYPAVSSPAGSTSITSDSTGGAINQSWHGSSLYSSLALSTASAITPPNVCLGSADGQSAPFVRNEKKKDKERVSLMKRLTSKCKSRSPPPVSNYSCDNSAFVDTPPNPSCGQPKVAPYVHIRSGSCPNEAFAGQNVNHKKSSSLDGSANEAVPKSVYRTKQPQPLVRERFRCIVPYPPNSELELELKVGDVVYVHRKREDGWYKGTLQRTGKTGLFPASFVESY